MSSHEIVEWLYSSSPTSYSSLLESGDLDIELTALVKHGSHYLHLHTGTLTVITCRSTFAFDPTETVNVHPFSQDSSSFFAENTVLTQFEAILSPDSTDKTSLDRLSSDRAISVSRQVEFKFLDTEETHLTRQCMAEAPHSFTVKCKAFDTSSQGLGQKNDASFFSVGDGLVSSTDLCSIEAPSQDEQLSVGSTSEYHKRRQLHNGSFDSTDRNANAI